MSAFFIAINRNRQAFDPKLAERMLSSIDRFGHDAKKLVVQGHFAIGYQAKWCVPEGLEERQPLFDADIGRWFVFHGRVDNRVDLFQALKLTPSSEISDASLMRRFFQVFGEPALTKVIGPFVFVTFDPSSDTVVAARDGMGGRYLCYRATDAQLLIATYELAIVTHGSLPYNFNDEKVARTLVNEMEPTPSSMIAGISPLNPGELLRIDHQGERKTRFYQPDPSARIKFATDEQYALEFKRLLAQAVTRRMRSTGVVGSMLSGGLDSVPMTIVAAQQSVNNLPAFSWVFDDYPELDERQYSGPICERFDIDQHEINCDHVWPQFDSDTHVNPIFPFGIPYSEFQQETFRRAQHKGVASLLTGIHGDLLYESTQGIFYELMRAARLRDAWREFVRLWRAVPGKWSLAKYYFLKPLSIVQKISWLKRRRISYPADCLQDHIAALIKPAQHWLFEESRNALRPEQWRVVLDGFAGEDAAHGRYMEAKYGIERRYPFRDRDLCEFMLAIPSDQLYFNLTKRPIVKRAFASEFTPELTARNSKTNFTPIIDQGIEKDLRCREWFRSKPPQWSYYVKECYFDSKAAQKQGSNVIQWRCGYYDYWKSVCYNSINCELGQNRQ